MTTPTSSDDFHFLVSGVVRQILIWIPIIVGLVFQFLMFFFGFTRIYVFLDPPEYIKPFVTLELGWWLVLTVATAVLTVLTYFERIRPRRLRYPFYLYLIFLLILVKPI